MQNKFNVLLIVIDSLRADQVGCINLKRNSFTPFVDSLMPKVVFQRCFSLGTNSPPAAKALLTGTYPLDFGDDRKILPAEVTIADIFRQNGYVTAAFHSNPFLSRTTGFNKGFDYFDDTLTLQWINDVFFDRFRFDLTTLLNKGLRMIRRFPYLPAKDLNVKVLKWLKNANRPFFIWVQYMDAHGPYMDRDSLNFLDKFRSEALWHKAVKSPNAITPAERVELLHRYQSEIKYIDTQLRNLMESLKELGLIDNTIVIITSDHGEEFGEHGYFTHGNKPYDSIIHVPLIFYLPEELALNVTHWNVKEVVCLIDVLPTLVDCLGLTVDDNVTSRWRGQSLWPLICGDQQTTRWQNCPFIIERLVGQGGERYDQERIQLGLRTANWKYIFDANTQSIELYDLVNDPVEKKNIYKIKPKLAAYFDRIATRRVNEIFSQNRLIDKEEIVLEKEVIERLRSLGYIE